MIAVRHGRFTSSVAWPVLRLEHTGLGGQKNDHHADLIGS